jgi:hypothetical protein
MQEQEITVKRATNPTTESAVRFARIWNRAATLASAVKKLGMTKASASVRAANLRAAGVPLKKFVRAAKKEG